MINIDTASLWREAYSLWKADFDWKIYKAEDLKFLNDQTISNIDINPVEELFFSNFSLEETEKYSERIILNQGEILNYMNIHASVNVSKYDIKDIFVKNKLNYKSYKVNGIVKCGICLYKIPSYNQGNEECPY